MKKLLSLFLCLLFAAPLLAQKNEGIKGSGNVVVRELPVTGFTKLEVGSMIAVVMAQGDKEAVAVEADDNLQDLVKAEVSDGTLRVWMQEGTKGVNLRGYKKLTVHLTFRDLTSMKFSTMGRVRSEGTLKFKELRIRNSSMGSIELDLTADRLDLLNEAMGSVTLKGRATEAAIRHEGMGAIKASEFVIDTLYVANKGMGSVVVNAGKQLVYQDSFMGKVRNVGAAPAVKRN
ncbi:GIN domain-containing protein [Flaviaesturariibacter amylovorans]|uniref:Putative auto-transporter adhesin head GIN domain-containing protein n=1 Tax=Flaviaesturariibacter amylovorans TaxID=1084520 RepID=A0ABP8HJR2_9BACT